MRSVVIAAACLLLGSGSPGIAPVAAQAPTAAVSCEVADFNLALRLYLPLAKDGTGAPGAEGMQGSLEIFHQKVPKERRRWSLDGKRPAQFWNQPGDLKLMLVLGGIQDPIKLVVDTRRGQFDVEYRGTFRLEAAGVKVTGRLACIVG